MSSVFHDHGLKSYPPGPSTSFVESRVFDGVKVRPFPQLVSKARITNKNITAMNASLFFYALVAAVLATTICNICVYANPLHCIPCLNDSENDCDDPPRVPCEYGETRDECGRRVCGKGPGDRCGGYFGVCGEGMTCMASFMDDNYERCHGCTVYRNMPCYLLND